MTFKQKIRLVDIKVAIWVACFISASLNAQVVEARKIEGGILVDGSLDEPEWAGAGMLTDFTQFEPKYGEPASMKTMVRILYDRQRIYIGIDCNDPEPSRISSKVTKRDGEVWEDDAVALILDTFDDDNNAYMFIVNALGTQQDERWADNGRTQDIQWDVEWASAGRIHDSGWSAEVAIPFKVIKFDRARTRWGFNVIRYIPRNLEMSHWIPGLTQWFRISEFGTLAGLDLRDVSGKTVTVIPYVQSQLEEGKKPVGDVGGDVRVNLSSNLGLDMTVNPDFATVEADVEQVNLTRFELSYPEKRPFFMEGSENYSTRIEQFYSRRIGEIPWGVKLNGKLGRWKVNALATQSDPATADPDVPAGKDAVYSVFRINREIGNASTVGIIGANRTYDGKQRGSAGLVATLFFTKLLGMTSQVIKSYGDYGSGMWTYFFRPSFDSKTGHFHLRYTHVGEHVRENMNDIGFIRDDDRKEFDTNIQNQFWINRWGVEEITPGINYNLYYSQRGTLRSWEVDNSLSVKFLKKWNVEIEYVEEFKRYEKDFRNHVVETTVEYDNKEGSVVSLGYGVGKNYDRDFDQIKAGVDLKLLEGWNLTYHIEKYWFRPYDPDDNSIIHYLRSTYYINKDMYCKVFYQTKYSVRGRFSDLDLDLSRETVQFVFVWRFLPPFGSLQLAYQQGTTRVTDVAGSEKTFFSKLSWVF
jgi:hypothetical protein